MTKTMTVANTAASFITDLQFDNLSTKIRKTVLWALTDYVGVTIGGSEMPAAKNLRDIHSGSCGSESAKVFGTDSRATIQHAALLNGTASHALDYDDVSWTTIGHPTVTVAPVIFACGEVFRKNGRDLVAAYVAGVEVQHIIAAALMPGVSDRGWHTTSVFGAVGAAAAAAKLYNLDERTTANALGIAASMAGGVRANFGSLTKAVHAGMACQQGVTAVMWAHAGITASDYAFEGIDGYSEVFSGITIDSSQIKFTDPFDLERNGLVFKKYPCCSGSHTAIDSLNDIIEKHRLAHVDIDKIEVGVTMVGPRELICACPQNAVEAKFSMQYALAARLFYNQVTLEEFTDNAVQNPDVQALMKKIHMYVDGQYDNLGFMNTSPANIQVHLKNGEVITARCDIAKGNPENPLSEEEFKEKFMCCTRNRYTKTKAENLFKATMQLDEYDEINHYINLL